MDFLNFKIEQSIYFVVEGHALDIHNDYNCLGFDYNFEKRQIIVSWNKGTGDRIPENIPSSLELFLNDVSILKTKERDSEMPFSEDDCVQGVGFANQDLDNEDLKDILEDVQSDDFSLFCICFQSGFGLYADAKTAELKWK